MPPDAPGLLLSEQDPTVLEKLAVLERASLAIVGATVLVSAMESFMPGLRAAFPMSWRPLSGEIWCATATCEIAIILARPRLGDRIHKLSMSLGALAALGSAVALIHTLFYLVPNAADAGLRRESELLQLHLPADMSPQVELGFLCLGLMIIFLQSKERLSAVTDVMYWLTGVVILTLASAQIVGALPFFGASAKLHTSHQTMLCLCLLGFAALACRARSGMLRIFLGHGTGSRAARLLAPVLLILPFLREIIRARLFNIRRMPSHYITAFLASVAVGVSYLLLIYLAWRINSLEEEVHELSLRDPLTDLYNLRGFQLLAEQALHLARRSGKPFSLLFIDVDGLKQINDELGHQTGSEFLVQTAEIMRETFREADVMGRIGGDEFAVAGQFSEESILYATGRLQDAATRRNASTSYGIPLSFSIGHVTSPAASRDSLDELLASADEAMYQVKRRRKAVLR